MSDIPRFHDCLSERGWCEKHMYHCKWADEDNKYGRECASDDMPDECDFLIDMLEDSQ